MFPKVLVIGQLPPPVHGSNVMTERFMESLAAVNIPAVIVEKKFSTQLTEVGKNDPKKLLKIPELLKNVRQTIAENKPDLCVYFISVGITSLLVDCIVLSILRHRDIPYVLYFHGLGYKHYESKIIIRNIVRKALGNALGGMVLGRALIADVSHCIPESRLYILPNAIPGMTPDEQQRLNRKKEKSYTHVVFLSNLIPAKGPMVVLRLAKIIAEKEPSVRFTLAGRAASTGYLNQIKAFIKAAGLESTVNLPGPVYGKEKIGLLCSADIFVFPTSFSKETFGIVNLEAIQWGIPVISSPIGAIPEIIQDGVNGFIVDPSDISLLADRVLSLVRNKVLRQEMGANGIQFFNEKYSMAAYRKNLRSAMMFFNDLISSDKV